MEIYKTDKMKIPVKLWGKLENIEQSALEQIETACSLPYVVKHMAVMPDCHTGYSCPIGSVIATKNVVVPFFVGVDIGCGMCAVKTSLTDITTEQLKKVLGGSKEYQGGIRSSIPVGFNHHQKKQDESLMPTLPNSSYNGQYIVEQESSSALKQLGTLGGGNHFIEIQQEIIKCDWCIEGKEKIMYMTDPPFEKPCSKCKGTSKIQEGNIWVMIHSGSRNLGYKVAKHYNELAQKLCKQWYSNIPEFKGEDGLAFLPLDSKEGQDYLREMKYCLEFAYVSRKLMMDRVCKIIDEVIHETWELGKPIAVGFDPIINIHHNFAQLENHFGQNVIVHRKGATSAKEGQIGIIPGSQGTASYIVRGKGNKESFQSCSHGAGRVMSRKKARNELNLEEEIEKLDKQGILHAIRHKNDLDEASSAYKNIDVVMEEQKDLVDIVVKLKPLAVVKG